MITLTDDRAYQLRGVPLRLAVAEGHKCDRGYFDHDGLPQCRDDGGAGPCRCEWQLEFAEQVGREIRSLIDGWRT